MWLLSLTIGACISGCSGETGPQAPDAICAITALDGDERALLVSEAESAFLTGVPYETRFRATAHEAVTLRLAGVGCNCYSVRADGRRVKVEEEVRIPRGEFIELTIDAEPSTTPGVKEFWAEFSGHFAGQTFSRSLSCRVQTLADIAVRPDVVTVAVDVPTADVESVIPIQIEQHARCPAAEQLDVAWNPLPDGVTLTAPSRAESPVEIQPGVWRCRWTCQLRVDRTAFSGGDAPVLLPIASLLEGRKVAESSCLVVRRRMLGIQAPRLVHLGRMAAGMSTKRRVQLRSLDGRAFAILSVQSIDGQVEADVLDSAAAVEHWLEVRSATNAERVDDELLVRTDHPESPELRVPVRGIGPG